MYHVSKHLFIFYTIYLFNIHLYRIKSCMLLISQGSWRLWFRTIYKATAKMLKNVSSDRTQRDTWFSIWYQKNTETVDLLLTQRLHHSDLPQKHCNCRSNVNASANIHPKGEETTIQADFSKTLAITGEYMFVHTCISAYNWMTWLREYSGVEFDGLEFTRRHTPSGNAFHAGVLRRGQQTTFTTPMNQ